MGQRYSIPFKDYKNRSYEVRVYIEGYEGEVTELTGARSAFTVEGSDENFAYEPIRTSSATLTVVGSDLLLDLFSINSQYAPVKLYKGEKLMWTGYIVPEQFTQPYKPTPDNIGIDCISAMGTLENIAYEQQTESGYITAMALLKYLVASAKGGYEKVYVPHVYASSAASYTAKVNVLEQIELMEENFTSEDMMLDEVLTYFCRFFAWTMFDYEGSLYFVDEDHTGAYWAYNEAMTTYTEVTPNSVNLQEIGFAGSNHTIDVLPGYNKATVKAINNVFDELVESEETDLLETVDTYTGQNDKNFMRKEFAKPKFWKIYSTDASGQETDLIPPVVNVNGSVYGAVLMKMAEYTGTEENGVWKPDVSDYSWMIGVQCRIRDGAITDRLIQMRGKNALWKDGAIAISGDIVAPWKDEAICFNKADNGPGEAEMVYSARIGDNWWNGTAWTSTETDFSIKYENQSSGSPLTTKNMKTPDMPYKGLSGYIIELPTDRVLKGELEIIFKRAGKLTLQPESGAGSLFLDGYIYRNLNFTYKKRDGANDEGENGDRLYENVVNEKYMNETDEIEFGISSYNGDGATYSKALLNGQFLTDNLYSAIEGKLVRPEEALIRRIVSRYRETKIKLTQIIKNSEEIHPFTVLSDNSMVSKRFMLQGGTWDYEQNSIELAMVENGDNI